jgi:hypothetical protein
MRRNAEFDPVPGISGFLVHIEMTGSFHSPGRDPLQGAGNFISSKKWTLLYFSL